MSKLERESANFINLFKELHINNSKIKDNIYPDYRELLSPTTYDDKHNLAYHKIRNLLLKKYSNRENLSREKSFIIYSKELFIFSPYRLREEGIHLELSKYFYIIKRNSNYFKYIEGLKNSSLSTLFKLDNLNSFCASITGDIIDTINIKNVKLSSSISYLDEEEEKDFDEIEKEWQEKNYNRVFYDCRALLIKHVSKYLGREIEDMGDDIEKFLQKIISDQGFPKLLEDSLNEIINQSRIMRNMLGKEEGETNKNKEWLRTFNLSEEKNKRLSTRITIDLMKTIHNILIVLEKEKNNE